MWNIYLIANEITDDAKTKEFCKSDVQVWTVHARTKQFAEPSGC